MDTMDTTFRIDGANCSYCFNDALEHLGRVDGVLGVRGSIAGSCIDVEHERTVAVGTLVNVLRDRLHGIEMYANEIRMVPLEPLAAPTQCNHGAR